MRSPSQLSRAHPRTRTTGVGSVSADESPWTACKHDETWPDPETLLFIYLFSIYFLERPAVSLKSAPAQLPAADAAVLGLFSVKQTGLLAFKPALHSLHTPSHPREEIETIFSQITPAFLIRPIIIGKKDDVSRVIMHINPSCPRIVAKINN